MRVTPVLHYRTAGATSCTQSALGKEGVVAQGQAAPHPPLSAAGFPRRTLEEFPAYAELIVSTSRPMDIPVLLCTSGFHPGSRLKFGFPMSMASRILRGTTNFPQSTPRPCENEYSERHPDRGHVLLLLNMCPLSSRCVYACKAQQ